MFGHKSDNQTTVGAPVVQNPSMLDNVSAQDFSSSDSSSTDGDVQQQVEQALNQTEMNKMLDSAAAATPTVTGSPFMSSPAAEPTAVIAPAPDPVEQPVAAPAMPAPVSDPDPTAVVGEVSAEASVTADNATQEVAVNENDIPRPLSPEENREIEAMPVASAVSSPVAVDGTSVTQESLSAPVAPPPAPDATPELPTMHPIDPTTETPGSDEVSDDTTGEASANSDESTSESSAEAPTESDAVASNDTASSEQSNSDEKESEESIDTTASSDNGMPAIDSAKLAEMKQQALDHLEPLADNLSQTPEEEFRTTMLRIQANDNHTLLEKALHAARNIADDKERAQAMLDIINEINYFSQQAE